MTQYTGRVSVGGPAQVRELAKLMITKVAVGPKSNNVYLLRCRATDQQLLIDAADEPKVLLTLIGDAPLAGIATTHRHADHVNALLELLQHRPAPTYAQESDADFLPAAPDHRVTDGDTVNFGDIELRCVHIDGHTPGGLALVYDDPDGAPHLFVGDSLFPGGPGATWGDAAAFGRLMDDLETKIFAELPDETSVYPGHGDDTTLGNERPHLAEWRARGW